MDWLLFLAKLLVYFYIAKFIFYLSKFVYKNFLRKKVNFVKRYGASSWVLVTGATDGLGKIYAEEFAKAGLNVILVSRSRDKLNRVAEEIKSLNKEVKTHVIEFDFDKRNRLEDYKQAFADLRQEFDISILVNNVGAKVHGPFSKYSIEDAMKVINVNVIPQTILTKIFEGPLSKRDNRSAIINLSSFASHHPMANNSTYSATKSYNYFLSRALADEYAQRNIDFLAVRLLFAESALSGRKSDGFLVIKAEQAVAGALKDLGYEKETFGHWIHDLQATFISSLPLSLISYGTSRYVYRNKTE